MSNEAWLDEHAIALLKLLGSEWLAPGYIRSWHARYEDGFGTCQASVAQQKGVEGFRIALVKNGYYQGEMSGVHMNLRAACIWLGLDRTEPPLDWHHEL